MSRRGSTVLCAVLAAAALGVGNEMTSGGDRRGFVVGLGDHVVLTPYGIHAADPTAFAGDWFIRAAPQPHWLFDLVVWAGRAGGNLPVALLLYYLVALGAFGAATALLARRWCGRTHVTTPWLAAAASATVGLLSAYQAIYLAGTNTLNSPLALPNVLGGNVAYLFLAALLTRRRWAPLVLPFVAAAHVQMGLLVLGAGALVWGYDLWRARRRFRVARGPLLGAAAWWLLGLVVALAGMRARSVASDPAAFVEICTRYIPFHCAARNWSLWQLLSTVAAAGLCLATAVVLAGRDRRRYLLAVGVPAVALVSAMIADRRGVPVLGQAVQAYNVYRLGNLIFPFAVWGVLAPLLPGARCARAWPRLLLAVAVAPLAVVFYTSPGVPSGMKSGFVADGRLATVALAALAGLLTLFLGAWVTRRAAAGGRRWVARPDGVMAAAITAVALGGLLIVRAAGFTGAPPAPLRWPASGAEAAWGAQARAVIPPEVQVLINPVLPNYKLALERGVVVDCKDLPYGGVAYREWTRRVDALGGWGQCRSYEPAAYDGLTGAQLDAAARRYGARAIVVAHRAAGGAGAGSAAAELVALGYRLHHVDGGTPALDTDILVRGGG